VSAELGGREVGDVLLKSAGSSVLLVMGSYGHWRWREWVFGGATLYVLRNTDVPVLMSH
jgi:nucleotide-binding universal stress UspA family protein